MAVEYSTGFGPQLMHCGGKKKKEDLVKEWRVL